MKNIRNIIAVSTAFLFTMTLNAESLIRDLPRTAVQMPAAAGALRLSDQKFSIVSIPAEFEGGIIVAVPRGAAASEALGYTIVLKRPATVYILVQDRGAASTLGGWSRTKIKITSVNEGGAKMVDSVYKRDLPAGTIDIPAHDGKDPKDGKFGVPHAAVIVEHGADTASEPVKNESFGVFQISDAGFAPIRRQNGAPFFSPTSLFVYLLNAKGDRTVLKRSERTADGWRYSEGGMSIDLSIRNETSEKISVSLTGSGVDVRAVGFVVGIDDATTAIVPGGRNGVAFRSFDLSGQQRFTWPRRWEAPVVVFEGARESVSVWTEDISNRYKSCVLFTEKNVKCAAFEVENFAPFAGKRSIQTPRWNMQIFTGGYKAALAPYRNWMTAAYRPGRFYSPNDKAAGIQSLIRIPSIHLSAAQPEQNVLLAESIAKALDPAKTLLWTVTWYDDASYRAKPDIPAAIAGYRDQNIRTRELGFLNFSYISSYCAITEESRVFPNVKPFLFNDEKTGKPLVYTGDRVPHFMANGLSPDMQKAHASTISHLLGSLAVDAVSLEQSSATWNSDGAFRDGRSGIDGIIDVHEKVLTEAPNAVLGAEGMADILIAYDRFCQTHAWEGVYNFNDLKPGPLIGRAHPISSYIFEPYCRKIPFLDVPQPTGSFYWQSLKPAYITWGTIPGLLVTSTNLLARYGYAVSIDEMRVWQDVSGKAVFCDSLSDEKRLTLAGNGKSAWYSVSDTGYELTAETPSRSSVFAVISNTAERTLIGMAIPNWPAWRGTTAIGLDPARYYLASRIAKQPSLRAYITEMPGRSVQRHYTRGSDAVIVFSGKGTDAVFAARENGALITDGNASALRSARVPAARWCAVLGSEDIPSVKSSHPIKDLHFSTHAVEGNSGFIQTPTSAVEKPEYKDDPPCDFAGKKADGIWLIPLNFGQAASSFILKTEQGSLSPLLELCLARDKGLSGITYEIHLDGERIAAGMKKSSGWERLTVPDTAVKAGYHLMEIIIDSDGPWNADIAFVSGTLSLR